MASWMINAVGVAAALCSMTSFAPQLVKIWRERDAGSVSLRMYVVTALGFSLWTAYGALLRSWPLVGSNLVSLCLALAILALKLRFDSSRGEAPKQKAAGR
jgi:MtN3 and saliva related transmembrane protein